MIQNEQLPGFRLNLFEVLNWGTFDGKIWSIRMDGNNSLLTGDIGSGKSTIIDALTTLLVPAGRITYNKAAGAESKERSLRDYILGQYKKEKDSESLSAKSVSLREPSKALTILLGQFHDNNFNETVTLAQIYWIREGKKSPERFFILSSGEINIKDDLYKPGFDALALKKKLKQNPNIEIFDSYSAYSAEFRRRLAIKSEQGIELLHQTVSMKSIGNLTEFVQQHMLEESDIQNKIDSLCKDFENLDRAHEEVLIAKEKIEILEPLENEYNEYVKVEDEIVHFIQLRECIYSYAASLIIELAQNRGERLNHDLSRVLNRIEKIEKNVSDLEIRKEELSQSIHDNGGGRINELNLEIDRLENERIKRKNNADKYNNCLNKLSIDIPADDEMFNANREKAEEIITDLNKSIKDRDGLREENSFDMRNLQKEYDILEKELKSLKEQPSNIPFKNLKIRKELCEAIGVNEKEIPFIGELIQVKDSQRIWEGAIERVFHNFGLSLMVHEDYYTKVSEYVNNHNLKGRLVYLKFSEVEKREITTSEKKHIINKISIKQNTRFHNWIESEILKRFDYICCDDIDEFRHQPKAVTAAGQIKTGRGRHEKDDRYDINDRRRYVLGWDNAEKIKRFEEDLKKLASEGKVLIEKINTLKDEIEELNVLRDGARDLLSFYYYDDIDHKSCSLKIKKYSDEITEIRKEKDILPKLQKQLEEVKKEMKELNKKVQELNKEEGSIENKIAENEKLLEKNESLFNEKAEIERQSTFPYLEKLKNELLKDRRLTVESGDTINKELRDYITKNIESRRKSNSNRQTKITRSMDIYINKYPQETKEIDCSINAATEFIKILHKLKKDDLPRFEENFKKLLKESTIQNVALLSSGLDKEKNEIEEKIKIINTSLKGIEYNKGTYIELLPEAAPDREIKDFQADLKLCLQESLGGSDEDDLYTEEKFIHVKEIVSKFRGRPNFIEVDKKWAKKVSDVRNWFVFSAVEKWTEDDKEKEFYSDSSGKSGGQKEKLAYTILGAALAYQFSLVKDGLFEKSFRFVMIDEAFAKGSDESTRYALELFKTLKLQLLVVTPLLKIHIIEKYINSVHLVFQELNRSQLAYLTIEEYRNQRDEI